MRHSRAGALVSAIDSSRRHPREGAPVSGMESSRRHPREGARVSAIEPSRRHPRAAPAFAGVTGDPGARSVRCDAGSVPGMRCGRAGFGAGALRAALDARSLPAPSPTLLLLLYAQEQPRAQLGAVRIGCEPGAAFLLRDNSLAQPARFIADTSARRRGSRPGPSNAKARSAGKTALLDPRLRGDDDLGDSARPRPRFPAFAHWCPQ
jgi:hypothetical protein